MSEVPSYTIHRITRNTDLSSMVGLIETCLNQHVDEKYFAWKYFDNPAGEVIGFVAIANKKIVSFYGVIPEWYSVGGEKRLIYQSMDTMTDPSFRRLGLFNKLALTTYEAVREIQPGFTIIGFPSPQSFPGFVNKLGWKHAFNWKYTFCYRLMFWICVPWIGKSTFVFKELNEISEDLRTYLQGRKPKAKIQKYLDSEILKWKTFDNRHKPIRVAGVYQAERFVGFFTYYIDTPKSCQILQIDTLPEVRNFAMKHLMKYTFEITNARCIYSWDPLAPAERKALSRLGFMSNPFNKGPFHHQFPFIVYSDPTAQASDWLDSESYHFEGIMLD